MLLSNVTGGNGLADGILGSALTATLKPGKQWDAWYAFLTEKHGLSKKSAFIGMSRGGEYAYTWATTHPDAVSCIYADNPGGNRDVMMRLGE